MTLGGALTRVQSFDLFGQIGSSPAAGLLQGTDGNFYGTLSGEIFKLTQGGLLTTPVPLRPPRGPTPHDCASHPGHRRKSLRGIFHGW